MKKLKIWMTLSTVKQKKELSKRAKIPVSYLYALLNKKRKASSELAARIELSSRKMKVNLLNLDRGDISNVCKGCPYYKKFEK